MKAAFLASIAGLVHVASASQIEPVADLNFAAYTGRWYQTYVSLSAPFQIGATCVTADYGVAADGKTVTITNTNRYNGAGLLSVSGYGAPNPDGAGELEVVLGRPGHPLTGIPVWGENPTNYVVAAVGPEVDSMYDYAIVGDPAGSILYILARDVARFEEQHEAKVLQQAADLGFTGLNNSPHKTKQDDCAYSNSNVESTLQVSKIEPVADLNFAAYVGRWYQTYVSLSAPFQIGATCVTADYGVAADGKTVTITNTNRYNGAGLLSVSGYGAPNPDGAGELEVVLGRPGHPLTGIPVWGENPTNYVVAAVGPEVDGMYDYAIVGDPAGSILYILARDVARFEEQHKAKVLQQAADLGFTGLNNSPHKTKQDGCTYDYLV